MVVLAVFLVQEGVAEILDAPFITALTQTGLVPRLATAVLGAGQSLNIVLSLICGLVAVTRGRIEINRPHYYSVSLPCYPQRQVSAGTARS
jgi:hypothetical protein